MHTHFSVPLNYTSFEHLPPTGHLVNWIHLFLNPNLVLIIVLWINSHKNQKHIIQEKCCTESSLKLKSLSNKALFVWLSLLVKGFPFPITNKFSFPTKTSPNETLIKSSK